MKQFNREEFEKKIIAKAWKDPQFKKNLLRSPKDALETFIRSEYGSDFKIPADYNYQVIEEHPNTFVLVLPDAPAKWENLSESELEAIAAAGKNVGITIKRDH